MATLPFNTDAIRERFSRGRRFVAVAVQAFMEKDCQKSAAALTYMTLFAIVPLMTVTYSMFSVIPAFQGMGDQLRDMIFEHFVPDTGQEIQDYLVKFSSQARKLTVAGVAMLVVTAYVMLNSIESTLNNIWEVKEGRRGLFHFLIYWALLSLGPLLVGIGMAMSTYLLSLRFLTEGGDRLGIISWVLQFFPLVLTSAAFTLLFAAVPNRRVPLKHALIGGVVTAICFELAKRIFSWSMSISSIEVVYGAFALVPLFLIWINLLWTIILAGAVLVRTLTTYQPVAAVARARTYPDLVAGLLCLWEFRLRLTSGESISDETFTQLGVEPDQWETIRDELLRSRVITATQQGEYVLCRDLRTVTLQNLADIVDMPARMPNLSGYLRKYEWFPAVAERLRSIDRHTQGQLDITLAEVFAMDDTGHKSRSGEVKVIETIEPQMNTDKHG